MLKKADLILAGVLVALSLLLWLLPQSGAAAGQARVVVRQGGRLLYEGPIAEDASIPVHGEYENLVVVRGGRVQVASATCPGQDCVHMGARSRPGEMIACAPNGLSVRIVGGKSEVDGVAE